MAQFPNESPIAPHDIMDLCEEGIFSGFEDELQQTTQGATQTKRDYDFTQAGGNGRIVLAKPRKGGHLWAVDVTSGSPNQGQWIENATYDPATGGIDDSQSPQNAPVPPGICPSCGSGGVSGKFCNVCGGPLGPPAVGVTPGQLGGIIAGAAAGAGASPPAAFPPVAGTAQPGQTPSAGAGPIAAPAHINPNRMEGKPKKEVIVPEGMTRVAKPTGFSDALDAMLAGADADQK